MLFRFVLWAKHNPGGLVELLKSETLGENDLLTAVECLMSAQPSTAIEQTLLGLLSHETIAVRERAIQVCYYHMSAVIRAKITWIADNDPEPNIRTAAFKLINEHRP